MAANLTIQGKEPQQKVLDCLLPYNSLKELEDRVTALFTPEGKAETILGKKWYGRFEDETGCDGLIDCLKGLPAEHEVVQEILQQGNKILSEIPAMTAANLYQKAGPQGLFPTHTPIYNAFEIADLVAPEVMYNNVQKASYHILCEHLSHPQELSYDDAPVNEAIRGMMGYMLSKPQELSQFAHFLEENKTGGAYLPTLYALLGDTRAVFVFIEALTEERPHIDFKFVGRRIRRILTQEHQVPLQYFEEQSTRIQNDKVKQRFRECCKLDE